MSQKWVRVDTAILRNPKFLQLQEDEQYSAIVLYFAALFYSGEHGLDGIIPEIALPTLMDARRCSTDAQTMLKTGLWNAHPGSYEINDWREYQPVSEEELKRSEHARKAAQARWAAKNGAPTDLSANYHPSMMPEHMPEHDS